MRRLLVFMGGADVDNYTGRTLQGIAAARVQWEAVVIVIGAQHPCRHELVATCASSGYSCLVQTDRMAELMEAADLAIGATGSASWERCCVGLPTIGVAVAENQRPIADALEQAGAIIQLGRNPAGLVDEIAAALEALAGLPERMKALARASAALVDGLGTQRVVERMILLS